MNVVSLHIPPLRDRREDIPLLAEHFLDRMKKNGGQKHVLRDDALRTMTDYSRQLADLIEKNRWLGKELAVKPQRRQNVAYVVRQLIKALWLEYRHCVSCP